MISVLNREYIAMGIAYGDFISWKENPSGIGYWEYYEKNRARFLGLTLNLTNLIDQTNRYPPKDSKGFTGA